MKQKLTTLLFGLLLAVGWTSSALAQSATYTAESIKDLKYEWTDANGVTQQSPYVQYNETKKIYESVLVTDPYQIYGLLRGVYMEKALPGPTYSAYTSGDVREDPVYYGGIDGGWNIGITKGSTPTGNVGITVRNYSRNRPTYISSIKVMSGNTVITKWEIGDAIPGTGSGWTFGADPYVNNAGELYLYTGSTGTININNNTFHLSDYPEIQVIIVARNSIGDLSGSTQRANSYISVAYNNNSSSAIKKNVLYNTTEEFIFGLCATTTNIAADGTYKPNAEGYTAVMVSVKDNAQIEPENWDLGGSGEFKTKGELIAYITRNINSVKLLTDGMRIGEGYKIGTVFNCDGTYNKFFILGKGQSRKKFPEVQNNINNGTWLSYTGEEVAFKQMYEEFSPTSGRRGDDIKDFYGQMAAGHVYNVVHDCASVIQNGHQFSMSGNNGTDAKSFTGLNFFIPDYRLKYWVGTDSIQEYDWGGSYYEYVPCDGREMNALKTTTGETIRNVTYFSAKYAQYNQDYAPKIGLYLITLSAEAEKSEGYSPDHRYYDINLEWNSSLNEMSGGVVPQTYVIYEVLYDENGVEYLDSLTTVNDITNWSIENYPQPAHSETHTYIIQGSPTDNEHPSFVAWSNRDQVVIPGYNDFMALELNHYESDFVVEEEKNYYRNFLTVSNENEENALTIARIQAGENNYTLYRFDKAKPNTLIPVADLGFQVTGNPATAKYVQFTVSYDNYQSQDQLRPAGQTHKYDLGAMGYQTTGDLCLHGNGDLIIEPNGPDVNFHSIVVKNGNGTTITSWNGGDLTTGWKVSPGATFGLYHDDYYLEGHGYIYIPSTMLSGNDNISVEIEASADAGSVARITVNDITKRIENGSQKNYIWSAQEVATQLVEDGMVRMGGLPIVDQFSASTAKNDHPSLYGYVLKYNDKSSGTVEVPVLHTGAVVNSYYTKADIDGDTDAGLTMDILTSEVNMNLSDVNSEIYHYILLGAKKNVMPVIDEAHTNYISYLQQRTDFTYREMLPNSPLFVEEDTYGYPAGPRTYFNESEKEKGAYNDYKAYVPVVETEGSQRHWYEVVNDPNGYGDYLNNTYGAPIWKTSVGQVEVSQTTAQKQMKQVATENGGTTWVPNPSTSWTANGEDYTLYFLSVSAKGVLPNAEKTNIAYEPYMFRVFIEDTINNKLRKFKPVYAQGDTIQIGLEDDGPISGKYCVGSYDINSGTWSQVQNNSYVYNFSKGISNDAPTDNDPGWSGNMMFGAPFNANSQSDFRVYVRFYYMRQGWNKRDGNAPDHPANASERGQNPGSDTGIFEIFGAGTGEVVSTTYYNAQGMQSEKPFDGLNIVVTRYSNGTTSTTKVIR